MRAAILFSVILLGSVLTGCTGLFSDDPVVDPFSVSRVVVFTVDNANIERMENGEGDVYDFVSASFVVRVSESTQASALSISYTDEAGNDVTRPLNEFTSLDTLTAGSEVVVANVNLTSGASLQLGDVVVATRDRGPIDWWKVDGYPIGVAMAPGSVLHYRASSHTLETFGLHELFAEDAGYRIDEATASFGVKYDGTFALSHAQAPQDVQAESQHRAHALSWKTEGRVQVPFSVSLSGEDLESGRQVSAGFELAEDSALMFDAFGKLWWNASLTPVRADLLGGNLSTAATLTAWLTGIDDVTEDDFSCAGTTRAERCEPSEFDLGDFTQDGPIDPSQTNLDRHPPVVDAEFLDHLTRLLSDEMRPGDEVRFNIDVDETTIPGVDDKLRVRSEAALRAVAYEQVTVTAGTFEALRVVERVHVMLEIGRTHDPAGKVVFEPIHIEETLTETDFWLHKDTYVPLRVDQRMPFDFERVAHAMIEATPEHVWAEVGVEKPDTRSFSFSIEARGGLELTQLVGDVRFSPWAVFAAFHGIGMLAPMMGLSDALWGDDDDWYGDDAYWYDDEYWNDGSW